MIRPVLAMQALEGTTYLVHRVGIMLVGTRMLVTLAVRFGYERGTGRQF